MMRSRRTKPFTPHRTQGVSGITAFGDPVPEADMYDGGSARTAVPGGGWRLSALGVERVPQAVHRGAVSAHQTGRLVGPCRSPPTLLQWVLQARSFQTWFGPLPEDGKTGEHF